MTRDEDNEAGEFFSNLLILFNYGDRPHPARAGPFDLHREAADLESMGAADG